MNLRTDDLTLLLDPADPLAADCLAARDMLRAEFASARIEASRWEPRPCPQGWTR